MVRAQVAIGTLSRGRISTRSSWRSSRLRGGVPLALAPSPRTRRSRALPALHVPPMLDSDDLSATRAYYDEFANRYVVTGARGVG